MYCDRSFVFCTFKASPSWPSGKTSHLEDLSLAMALDRPVPSKISASPPPPGKKIKNSNEVHIPPWALVSDGLYQLETLLTDSSSDQV